VNIEPARLAIGFCQRGGFLEGGESHHSDEPGTKLREGRIRETGVELQGKVAGQERGTGGGDMSTHDNRFLKVQIAETKL